MSVSISIHVLREEDDQNMGSESATGLKISIHVLREEDDARLFRPHRRRHISIHVLREEDDGMVASHSAHTISISIHVLREEDDGKVVQAGGTFWIFLSTSSARRTTYSSSAASCAT